MTTVAFAFIVYVAFALMILHAASDATRDAFLPKRSPQDIFIASGLWALFCTLLFGMWWVLIEMVRLL